jgi:drug/metabolite transporter (DMT)-like permease
MGDLSHPSVWIAVLYMSIFITMIATTAYLKGQECIEASEASLFSYLSPLIFFPVSIFLLHEHFNPLQMVGLFVVLVGVVVAEVRIRRLVRVKPKKVLKHVKVKNAFKLKENC